MRIVAGECYLRVFLSFNLQYLSYERRRVVKYGSQYLSCITHVHRVKQLIGLNAKLAVLSDLVSGYGGNFFSAGVCYGD